MASLVNCQHHVTAAGKLNGKAILCFAGVDVAMYGKYAGSRVLSGDIFGYIQQGAHGQAISALKAHITDFNIAPVCLSHICHQVAHQYHQQGNGEHYYQLAPGFVFVWHFFLLNWIYMNRG